MIVETEEATVAPLKTFYELLEDSGGEKITLETQWRGPMDVAYNRESFCTAARNHLVGADVLREMARLDPQYKYVYRGNNSPLLLAIDAGRRDVEVYRVLGSTCLPDLLLTKRPGGEPLHVYAEKKLGYAVGVYLESLARAAADTTPMMDLISYGQVNLFYEQLRKRDPKELAQELLTNARDGRGSDYNPFVVCIIAHDSTLCNYVLDVISNGGLAETFRKQCLESAHKFGPPIRSILGTEAGRDIELVQRIATAGPEAIKLKATYRASVPLEYPTALELAYHRRNLSPIDLEIYNVLKLISNEHENSELEVVAVQTATESVCERIASGEVIDLIDDDDDDDDDDDTPPKKYADFVVADALSPPQTQSADGEGKKRKR